MNWPQVTVIICTYNRFTEFTKTFTALLHHLQYPLNRLTFLIADDASPGEYVHELIVFCESLGSFNLRVSVTPQNGGWGVNVNQALHQVQDEYVFFVEDDYVLTRDLDLRAAVALMLAKSEVGMVRFRGTAGDHVIFHQMEADVSPYYPEYREGVGLHGKLTYFLLDSGSPCLYLYSHGAHLKRRNFHEVYGYYPEGLKLGATEEAYAHVVKDGMRANPYAPVITIQPGWVAMWWDHVGKSYQHTDLDRERPMNV